ncbi:hypothetical protein A3709_13800 [Halioglobus sp. HI00S01]|uniref:hypothetical protein n=1 Tax=Halioglobus sp. HI00S01 TaxID=1822214 RepID=UPI0007C2A9A0|nr:hypothetical protein [Halioglobus sp. HI00S01]KZX59368.1 hypothetical protein A3709_13800 [Halioglobus sp. HI00S01]
MTVILGNMLLCALLVWQSLAAAAPMDCEAQSSDRAPCHEQVIEPALLSMDDCDHCQDCLVPNPVAAPMARIAMAPGLTVIHSFSPPAAPLAPVDDIDHPPNSQYT